MRSDFGRVVIERPRTRSWAPGSKVRHYGKIVNTEDGPEYFGETKIPLGSRAEGYDRLRAAYDKSFTDVLGPIDGYLRKQVGRKWDDVYSELSKALGQGTWPIRHILEQHIDVETNTYRARDGGVYADAKHGYNYRVDRSEAGHFWRRPDFYVEPETGVLRESKKGAPAPKKKTIRKLDAGNGKWYAQIKGVWYLGSFKPSDYIAMELQKRQRGWGSDVALRMVETYEFPNYPIFGERMTRFGMRKTEVGTMVFVKEKQLNKKELRDLRNRINRSLALTRKALRS